MGKKEPTDDEIKTIAKECGFWGVDGWWEINIPRLRAFLERVEQEKRENIQ